MISEDGQRVIGQSAGAHMENAGQQLAGDLEHIRDHQQETLGGGEGGGQGAGRQRTVNRAGRTGFGFHLGDMNGLAEKILTAGRGPLVGDFRHGGGRSNRVNGCHIAERICDMADGCVAVHCLFHKTGTPLSKLSCAAALQSGCINRYILYYSNHAR